jgi:N-acetylglucosaminyl-diphospho-decaprenol L-rhamnosyltransferase
MKQDLRVSLVIAVYNQLLHTMQCLESILRLADKVGEIIIVDNASSDGTAEYLKGLDGITVIRNATNLGCAKAWNQGIQASKGDVIGILNNDIVVTSGWLPALLRFMEESGHGIVSPAMREGPLDYELDKYASEFTSACRTATRDGFLAPCMLVQRVVFDQIGLFDEGFSYGGFEDVDFLWRAQQADITTAVTGSAFIHHFGMVTRDAVKRTESNANPTQNLAHFRRKWGRTVRGNWLQRRWTRLRETWIERYERFKYGHTLVERE